MASINFSYTPEVSIILCTYNRAHCLLDCLQSVLAQDFQNWELIVVDDGSSDETFNVINPLLQKDQRIRYIKHQNRKVGFSRNAGIQASFGKYITFIDSDDLYLPHHISSRVDYMHSHEDIDILSGGLEVKGDVWVSDYYQRDKKISIYDCVAGGTFFGKREVYFELKGFQPKEYGDDTDFWARAEEAFNVAKITEPPTYIYIRTADSITGKATLNLI
ncbi:glycosyl transferase family 2 [[Leptolyngbya] sp. PCC 7376]|uniref:glycosyltransferase family 2 protein n=1 Tax=[Leptolyngbya] sp. PCC 7376 TaxID=111781 RepID=UPI00029EF304|nr:glycosyltransferase family A protein [[Leptolyngbya] sp. PCC 7376]AFY38359.1 glycosyl transferase family 2 [[Leptolyngbya] sp. PCC 7376]